MSTDLFPINDNHSNTTDNGQTNPPDSSVTDSISITILSLTIVFSIVCIILIISRRPFRTNKHNWFTINVCSTTILLSVVMMSLRINFYLSPTNIIPCRIQAFLTIMAACQMMYSHSVIAINRYFTIIHSNKGIYRSTAFICLCLAFGWIIAFLLSIPYLVLDSFACLNSIQSSFLSYYTLVVVLVIPIHIVFFCNIRIFLFVRQSSRRVQTEGSRTNPSQVRDVRLIKTMVITFIVFVIGWIPLSIEQLFHEWIDFSFTISTIFQMLPSFSMLFNVLLLIYTNQPIRLFLYEWFVRHRRHLQVNTIGLKLTNYH